MKRVPRRGDVYWVALDPVIGTGIRKSRPAIVVSDDSCNQYGTRVVVMPVTSQVGPRDPGDALIEVHGTPPIWRRFRPTHPLFAHPAVPRPSTPGGNCHRRHCR